MPACQAELFGREVCIQANTENIVTCISITSNYFNSKFYPKQAQKKTRQNLGERDRLHFQVTTNKKHHT